MDAKLDCAKLPIVDPIYFTSGEHELFGVHYLPVRRDIDHAVLICPAYGHEYIRARRKLQQLAVQLAQNGCHVLRFDYSATGNSTGTCEQANVNSWRDDVQAAAAYLRQTSQKQRLSIVGVRLGATLACRCRVPNVQSLVLWDPISSDAALCQLLEAFLDKSLLGSKRFPRGQKRTVVDSADGYRTLPAKCDGVQAVVLPNATQKAESRHVIASRGYAARQLIEGLSEHWQVHQTGDAIDWHLAELPASDFSSGEAFESILSIMTNGESLRVYRSC